MPKLNEGLENVSEQKKKSFSKISYRDNLIKTLKTERSKGNQGKVSKEIALESIENDGGVSVIKNLDHISGLDKEIFLRLLDEHYVDAIKNIDKFEGLDKDVAMAIIGTGMGNKAIVKNIDKFEGLDKDVALKLIDGYRKKQDSEAYHDIFTDVQDMLDKTFRKKYGKFVANNLDKFEGLDNEVAEKLTEAGYGDIVKKHPEKFGLKKDK